MPIVNGPIIGTLVRQYYLYMKNSGHVFRIGLNMSAQDTFYSSSCTGTEVPGCVDATYEEWPEAGSFTAKFSATFTPSSSATLNKLSLVVLKPDTGSRYANFLVEMDGFSIQLTGGTQYSISIEHKITNPTTI